MKPIRSIAMLLTAVLLLSCGCRAKTVAPSDSSAAAPVESNSGISRPSEPTATKAVMPSDAPTLAPVESEPEISITPSEQTVTSDDPIQLVFKNNTDRTLCFGEPYKMEYMDQEWVPVDLTGQFYSYILYVVKSGEEATMDFRFPTKVRPDLPNGLYRVTLTYADYDEASGDIGDTKPMQFEITYEAAQP